jgi:Holliday junction resolvasome RuvABC endonuclease subunit
MHNKTKTIIGINPGTRYLGFAVFCGPELRDWGVKVAKGPGSKQKMEKLKKIVLGLIEQYKPEVLAVKKLHPSRSSPSLVKLTQELKKMALKKSISVHEYPIGHVKALLATERRMNKIQLAELLAEHYPHLYPELEKELTNKNSYYTRMFEAVALGHISLKQIDK